MNKTFELILRPEENSKHIAISFRQSNSVITTDTEYSIVNMNLADFPDNDSGNTSLGQLIRWLLTDGLTGDTISLVSENEIDDARKTVELRARSGDVKAQFVLGDLYLEDSIRLHDLSHLDLAEEWFRRAAEAGDKNASDFLDGLWPEIKAEYRDRIYRARGGVS